MADKPIIFSAPMVRALLDGTKTQTRRVLKPQPVTGARLNGLERDGHALFTKGPIYGKQRLQYAVGDRLWVRENWQGLSFGGYLPTKSQVCDLRYAATDTLADAPRDVRGYPWRPSIHMPRYASRLTLTVTDVRVQRLQEISLGDICAEGLARSIYDFAPFQRGFDAFDALWDSIHGKGAAVANPWVAAYTFTVQRGNIDQMPGVADG